MSVNVTTCEPIWLKHPKSGYVVLVTHEDTRVRCLSEGWKPAADPNALTPAPDPVPDLVAESAAAPAEVTPPRAQPSVAGHSFDDLTAVGDSPEELAQALEAAAIGQVRDRNTHARAAFGVEQPRERVASVKPAKAGQQQRGGRYAG